MYPRTGPGPATEPELGAGPGPERGSGTGPEQGLGAFTFQCL